MKKLSVCSALVAGMIGLSAMCFSGNAAVNKQLQLQKAEHLAENYVTVAQSVDEVGTETITYGNIAEYKEQLDKNYYLTETEKAKLLYKSMGMSEERIEGLSETELSEAFKFTECISTTAYIVSNDDESVNISQNEMVNALAFSNDLTVEGEEIVAKNQELIVQESGIMPLDQVVTNANDGYMRLITTAYREDEVIAGNVFFTVSVEAVWLKIPVFKSQDVFVLNANATYDTSYLFSGSYWHNIVETVTKTGAYVNSYGRGYTRTKGDDHAYDHALNEFTDRLWFEFPSQQNYIALRFYMDQYQFNRNKDHTYKESYSAFIRGRYSLFNVNGGISAAYSHKTYGADGLSIGVSAGYNSVSFSVGTTLNVKHTDYFGETLSLYYNDISGK